MSVTLANIRTVGVNGCPMTHELPAADRVRAAVRAVLDHSALCACATVCVDGQAHINTAYFAYSVNLSMYLLSHPDSVHCRNLTTNPSMAVAVFDSTQDWGAPGRGVQLFGTCTPVRGDASRQAEGIYGTRFRAYIEWKPGLKPEDPALAYRFYEFRPAALKIMDEREFGDAVWVHAEVVATDLSRPSSFRKS